MNRLGEYIAKVRLEKNWSQRELAKKAGLSFMTIQAIENGTTRSPGIAALLSISKALGTPMNKLILAYEGRDPDQAIAETGEETDRESFFEAIRREMDRRGWK